MYTQKRRNDGQNRVSSVCHHSSLIGGTYVIETLFQNENDKINGCFRTIYSHFLASCMIIFQKTEVQTVILMCWMGQNPNWFKSNSKKCKCFHFTDLANLQKNNKWWMAILRPFLGFFSKLYFLNENRIGPTLFAFIQSWNENKIVLKMLD